VTGADGPAIGEKSAEESATFLSEIVGDAAAAGRVMPTGAVLDLMDILAGRVAYNHVGGMVATVSFDHVHLRMPICHTDLVRVEGRLVHVGASSLVVRVVAYKQQKQTRAFVETASSLITMVALDKTTLRPNKNIPRLKLETEQDRAASEYVKQRRALYAEWTRLQKQEEQRGTPLTVQLVEEPRENQLGKREFLSISDTVVEVRKQCLPRHLNHNQTLFGGDILKWMEQTALYTAQRFTGNNEMMTLSMNRVSFTQPIMTSDILDMRACVVYVRKYVLEVEVQASVDRSGDRRNMRASHTGYFEILNMDSIGFKTPISVGIKLSDDNPQDLLRYQMAKTRFLFERQQQQLASTSEGRALSELERARTGLDENDDDQHRKHYLS